MTPITPQRIEELRALCKAAKEEREKDRAYGAVGKANQALARAAFTIATIDALCARVQEVEAENERLRAVFEVYIEAASDSFDDDSDEATERYNGAYDKARAALAKVPDAS